MDRAVVLGDRTVQAEVPVAVHPAVAAADGLTRLSVARLEVHRVDLQEVHQAAQLAGPAARRLAKKSSAIPQWKAHQSIRPRHRLNPIS